MAWESKIMLVRWPHSLTDLASFQIEKYISQLFRIHVSKFNQNSNQERAEKCLEESCLVLKKYFNISRPTLAANEIAFIVLKCLSELTDCKLDPFKRVISHLSRHPTHLTPVTGFVTNDKEGKFSDWKCKVARSIFNAIFQPTITRMVCNCYLPLLSRVILPELGNLQELTFNNSKDELLPICVRVCWKLQKFVSNCCSDEVLQGLYFSCQYLKVLDISDSEDVTDAGLEYISGMKSLEELHIMCMKGISPCFSVSGLEKVFKSLSDVPLTKLSLAYDVIDEPASHLALLAESFPLLKSLFLYFQKDYIIMPLQKLEHLDELGLGKVNRRSKLSLSSARELFQSIGKQITKLHLHCIWYMDFKFLGHYFPFLKYLDCQLVDNMRADCMYKVEDCMEVRHNIVETLIHCEDEQNESLWTREVLRLYSLRRNMGHMLESLFEENLNIDTLKLDCSVLERPCFLAKIMSEMKQDRLQNLIVLDDYLKIHVDGDLIEIIMRDFKSGTLNTFRSKNCSFTIKKLRKGFRFYEANIEMYAPMLLN